MEEQKREMLSEISYRVKIIYMVFTALAISVFLRIGYVQFLSHETSYNAVRLHKTIIFKDTTSMKARRGSILARNGEPLATSIFRQSIFFDFGSEGFDNSEKFYENADALSKLLSTYFHDKSAKEYLRIMTTEHNRCLNLVHGRDSMHPRSDGIIARWVDRIRGEEYKTLRVYDTMRNHSYVRLFRDIDFNEWQVLSTYPILNGSCGLVYGAERKDYRVYPNNLLALRTIGRIDVEKPFGIENAYREQLQGRDGYQWLQHIAPHFNSRVNGAAYENPEDGLDVVTTIDVDVQDVVDKELRHQLIKESAIWGTSIVMECATGDILAMVNLGKNANGEYVENRNYALGARMEPGSTFKLAALLALLEDRHLPPSTTYDAGHKKRVKVGAASIEDDHDNGEIDMVTAFAQSSNVWFAKAVYEEYKDHPQDYVDFIRSLNLDRTIGLDMLGEATPNVRDPKNKRIWDGTTLANMGYGYCIEIAPIHTLTLYNAVANNGKMVAPRIVSHITRGGRTVEEFPTKTLVNRICGQAALSTAHKCLEEVAKTGTARMFFKDMPFGVGAKTGTAKVSQGGISYKDGYNLGSMVTYFPADNPKYTIMTAIYKRKGDGGTTAYGAGLAGPVQKRIVTFLYNRDTNWAETVSSINDTIRQYPVYVKGGDIQKIRKVITRLSPNKISGDRKGWGRVVPESNSLTNIVSMDSNKGIMPNVIGMGLSDAIFILEKMGMKVSFSGSGRVVGQSITAGTVVRCGDYVVLKLK